MVWEHRGLPMYAIWEALTTATRRINDGPLDNSVHSHNVTQPIWYSVLLFCDGTLDNSVQSHNVTQPVWYSVLLFCDVTG